MRGRQRTVASKENAWAHPADALVSIGDEETKRLAVQYIQKFRLEAERLWVTTDRRAFQSRLGRRIEASIGGAYVYHPVLKSHLILINLPRIDRGQPKALEIVVAEEFLHMRDWLDGDRRRHSKHGYDRIAHRVAGITGATLQDVRSCLLPKQRRPARYLYRCPGCSRTVQRRLRGTWSCVRCSPKFERQFVLILERGLFPGVNHQTNGDSPDTSAGNDGQTG